MELIDVLHMVSQQSEQAAQPTDYVAGMVTGVNPLQITTSNQAAPLQESVLLLTAAVVEKKLTSFAHSHDTVHTHVVTDATIQPAGNCSTELGGTTCYENGVALPNDGYVVLNRALEVGDRVLMLRVNKGQKYIVLSRVYDAGGGR